MQRVFVRNTRSVQGDYLRQLVLESFNPESAKCKLSISSPVISCGTNITPLIPTVQLVEYSNFTHNINAKKEGKRVMLACNKW